MDDALSKVRSRRGTPQSPPSQRGGDMQVTFQAGLTGREWMSASARPGQAGGCELRCHVCEAARQIKGHRDTSDGLTAFLRSIRARVPAGGCGA